MDNVLHLKFVSPLRALFDDEMVSHILARHGTALLSLSLFSLRRLIEAKNSRLPAV